MKTIILLLLTLSLQSQTTFIGINGGKDKNTIGIGVNLRQDIYNNIGLKVNYIYSEYYDKDIFSFQSNYIINKNSFYTPMISAGIEFNNTTNPLLSFNNLFKIEYFYISIGKLQVLSY